MNYRLFWTHLGWFCPEEFPSSAAAIEYAQSKGYTATIFRGDDLVAAWDAIGGTRIYEKEAK